MLTTTLRASRRCVAKSVAAGAGRARCRTPVNEPPRANSGFRRGSVIRDASATREMVHMLGEQSVSDRIQGEWETREVYLAGRRLSPSESLAVARHSAHGFGWGDGGSGRGSARARATTACHRQGERRRSLLCVQVGGHRSFAAGGLHLGAFHGPRLACLAVRGVRVLRPNRLRNPPRATMHQPPSAGRAH